MCPDETEARADRGGRTRTRGDPWTLVGNAAETQYGTGGVSAGRVIESEPNCQQAHREPLVLVPRTNHSR